MDRMRYCKNQIEQAQNLAKEAGMEIDFLQQKQRMYLFRMECFFVKHYVSIAQLKVK